MQIGIYKTKDHESARCMMQEVSELGRIPTPFDKSISGDFFQKKLTEKSLCCVTRDDCEETFLCWRRTNYRSVATPRASWASKRKITVDQVTFQTWKIKDRFSAKNKAGAVLLDLAADFNTVWQRSPTGTGPRPGGWGSLL